MKQIKDEELSVLADKIYPCISFLLPLYNNKILNDFDLVGVIILIHLSFRKPKKWITKLLDKPITANNDSFSSLPLSYYDEIILNAIDVNYIIYKLKDDSIEKSQFLSKFSVIEIFNRFSFYGIKNNNDNYINNSIVNWCLGLRPYILLTYVPTPMEVLRMQCHGQRVITVFTSLNNLKKFHIANLYYMQGDNKHSKDPLEFTLHDIKHMENFIDNNIYYEQIGILRSLLFINNQSINVSNEMNEYLECKDKIIILKPKLFFINNLKLDEQLWHELEYVISDMNCYCIHMLKYILAKLVLAIQRKYSDNISNIETICKDYWSQTLIAMNIYPHINDVYNVAMSLLDISFKIRDKPLTAEEGEILRSYFSSIGNIFLR